MKIKYEISKEEYKEYKELLNEDTKRNNNRFRLVLAGFVIGLICAATLFILGIIFAG